MSGYLPHSFAGDSGPLATNINQEVSLSSWLMNLLVFRSPAEEQLLSSRDRGSLHCRRSGEQTLNKPFTSSILCMKCDYLTMAPNEPNQTPIAEYTLLVSNV